MAVARPHRLSPPAPAPGGLRRRLLLALALGALVVGPIAARVQPTEAGVAPACTYADVVTRYRGQGDWYRSLVDTKYRLATTFAPTDLVAVTRSGASGSGYVRRIALADLTAMYRAAKAAGAPFAVQSAYRSYSSQVATFNGWVRTAGYSRALLASARPGHSEHQLGTALDLKSAGGAAPWLYSDWGTTKAGAWIARNGWRYGWVLSYPKGKSPSATCYKYEPWHVRYVGRTIAAKIHGSGLAPREWLYVKGATGTWSGGLPSPTPTPKPTPSPTPSPTPTPTPTASSTATSWPSIEPTPTATAAPGPTASPSPTATAATAAPTASPTPTPEEPSASTGSGSSPAATPLDSPPPTGDPTPVP